MDLLLMQDLLLLLLLAGRPRRGIGSAATMGTTTVLALVLLRSTVGPTMLARTSTGVIRISHLVNYHFTLTFSYVRSIVRELRQSRQRGVN